MSCCTSAPIVTQTCETLLSKCEVPIIDLAHMGTERSPQKGVVKQVATKLVRALSEKGLALLVNHGIPECKLKAAYRALDEFSELSEETKNKYERDPSTNHGYVKPGMEKFSDEEEIRHAYNITVCKGALPQDEVPGFKPAVEELARDFKQLSAMLLTDCEGGLEIQTPRGDQWRRVGHLPGAILVNTGTILAKWTNDQFPALRHRVVVPEHCGRGRHSIAFFVHPNNDIPIEPLDIKIVKANQESAPCRLQKKKRGVLTAYHHLQRRFRETYAS
ncbi:jasmonate-induced oxygenase 2-like isoform X2 [Vespa velutina]|uniref:jasmonate-induced oxygenase 2-like isoform X2 n=1 Tax=Vespa velutina TaxID=202808 RepID=UPI001FB2A84C|nr:jasmonate-induced oxygenase 2-like isoform X2 [Vespa velutina]